MTALGIEHPYVAQGRPVRLVLHLPRMSPSRFTQWLEHARRTLGEVSYGVTDVEARSTPEGSSVRIVFNGNCWTYTMEWSDLVALESILGSRPEACFDRLIRKGSSYDDDAPWECEKELADRIKRHLNSTQRPQKESSC